MKLGPDRSSSAVLVAALGSLHSTSTEVPQAEKEAKKEKLRRRRRRTPSPAIELVYPDRDDRAREERRGLAAHAAGRRAPPTSTAVKAVVQAVTGAEVQKSLDDAAGRPRHRSASTSPSDGDHARHAKDGAQPADRRRQEHRDRREDATSAGGDDAEDLLTRRARSRSRINKQAKDLRDKQLLTFKDDDVTAHRDHAKPTARRR